MKNFTYQFKSLRFFFRLALLNTIVILISVTTVACGKKKRSSSTPTSTSTSTLLGAALGFSGNTADSQNHEIELGLVLSGEHRESGAVDYNGPVYAEGTMFVKSASSCSMPVGYYTLYTTNAGHWDHISGMFYNLNMEAHHDNGTIFQLRMIYGMLKGGNLNLQDSNRLSYPYALIGDIIVTPSTEALCGNTPFTGSTLSSRLFFTY